ncbi:hypothetical protein SAMN00777080_0008 [Aquiflexum balticum DSM 16537]|uniref:Viral A-type inclusion protein n=1 Tax=Aquiflexum balticum DSM 16537 TaxID=758820 RepID=A0A1W2GXR6_9BACT|nr:hypothetical protein [Aquiflexum balticum]SMD41490.1 hypothetical protein SAMN00777080_0008 [Aquiflexum balticum DSM 16537]
MLKLISKVIFLSFLASFVGCEPNIKNQNQELKQEVIDIHDEVMPLMGDLKSLKKKIDEKKDMISQSDPENIDKINELETLSINLDSAFNGMFVWMRQFQSSYDDMSEAEVETYLLGQKVKVEKVNEDIKKAMTAAKKELES